MATYETHEERVQHLVRLREVQDEDPGFFTFIPLAYQISSHRLRERQASAIEDLKVIAPPGSCSTTSRMWRLFGSI